MEEEETLVSKLVKEKPRAVQGLVEQSSAEESDTVECTSENEVENIPKDVEVDAEPIVTDEKGRRISGGGENKKLDVDELPQMPGISDSRLRVKNVTVGEAIEQHTTCTTAKIRVNSSPSAGENIRITSSKYSGSRVGVFVVTNRSPQSSSSQEEYEPEVKNIPAGQHLLTASTANQVSARSMESLRTSRNFLSADERYNSEDSRSLESLSSSSETHVVASKTHYRSFLTSSKKDVRRIVALESKSSENLLREESLNAEVRRGLFASTALERKIPQQLSLPPPSSVFSLTSPGGSDRKITILSPHSPLQAPDFPQFSIQTLKSRRKKAIVLPRLVLPRDESEVFLE